MTTDKLDKFGRAVAQGSIRDVADSTGQKPEELLMNCDVIVMLDQSGSMYGVKNQRAEEALRDIQRMFPGRVLLIEFSDTAEMNLRGIPTYQGGGTNMHLAIDLAKNFDVGKVRFYLISDGMPTGVNNEFIFKQVQDYKNPIYTIFIGADSENRGEAFMRHISLLTKGKSAGKIEPEMLAETMIGMLTQGGNK